jgi:hypothetical protein
MRDALFDGEGMRDSSSEPASCLGDEEGYSCDDKEEGPGAAAPGSCEVCGLSFGYREKDFSGDSLQDVTGAR